MEDILHQPSRGELFPALFPIIAAANEAGAYGSYLSGGGSTVAASKSFCAAGRLFHDASASMRASASASASSSIARSFIMRIAPDR